MKPVNPKPPIFETGLQSGFFFSPTGLANSRGRLKPDIFKVNYIIYSGPALNEDFQVQNGGQQCSVCNFAGSRHQSCCMS